MTYVKLVCADVIDGLKTLEDESIDLIVTSPPYGVGMEYEKDISQKEYSKLVMNSCEEFKRVLKQDGRICCNVPFSMNYENSTSFVMHKWMTAILEAGLNVRDIIVWNQSNSGNQTSWGSWKSCSSPWIRHQCECIVVGFKNQWKKIDKGESDMTSDEFLKYVVDMWTMPCARSKWHPAVFPEELPHRCIKLFSYVGDTVLDPFCGTATVLKVARNLSRNAIGIERKTKYCNKIRNSNAFNQRTLDNTVDYVYEEL